MWIVADRDHRTPKSRAHEIADQPELNDDRAHDQDINAAQSEFIAERFRRRDTDDAVEAARQPTPFAEQFLDDASEGERDQREIPGRQAKRRQRHQRPRDTGCHHRCRRREPEREMRVDHQDRGRVSAYRDQCAMTERNLSRVTHQKVQRERHDHIYPGLRRQIEQKVARQPDGQRHDDEQSQRPARERPNARRPAGLRISRNDNRHAPTHAPGQVFLPRSLGEVVGWCPPLRKPRRPSCVACGASYQRSLGQNSPNSQLLSVRTPSERGGEKSAAAQSVLITKEFALERRPSRADREPKPACTRPSSRHEANNGSRATATAFPTCRDSPSGSPSRP